MAAEKLISQTTVFKLKEGVESGHVNTALKKLVRDSGLNGRFVNQYWVCISLL